MVQIREAALDSEFKCLRCYAGDFPGFLRTDLPTASRDWDRTSIHSVVTAQSISNTYSRTYLCTYSGTRVTACLLVSLGTHRNAGLLTSRGSGIESGGSSLFSLDSEDRVSKRVESALDDIQRM